MLGRLQKGGERQLLCADYNGVVAIFDMRRGREQQPHLAGLYQLHESEILCMAFNERDGLVYTAGNDTVIRAWDERRSVTAAILFPIMHTCGTMHDRDLPTF